MKIVVLEPAVAVILDLEVGVAPSLDCEVVDTTCETAEVAVIDETVPVATDESEMIDESEGSAVDEPKLIAVNVYPLTEGVAICSPILDRTTVIIKCCMKIVWSPHIG